MCGRQYPKSSVVVEEYYTAHCISTRRVAVVNDFSVAATWLVGIRVDRIVVYTMIWCIHLDNAYTAVVSIAIVVTLHLSLHMYAGHMHILSVLCLLRIHCHVFKVTYLAIVHHIYYFIIYRI